MRFAVGAPAAFLIQLVEADRLPQHVGGEGFNGSLLVLKRGFTFLRACVEVYDGSGVKLGTLRALWPFVRQHAGLFAAWLCALALASAATELPVTQVSPLSRL